MVGRGGLELLEEIRKDPVLTALLSKDEILVSAIESHVSRGGFGEAFSLLRLLYNSWVFAGEEQGTECGGEHKVPCSSC